MLRRWVSATCGCVLFAAAPAWAQEFTVKRVADDEVVLTGALGPEFTDPDTNFVVRHADFTAVEEPGEYYLDVAGVGRSITFRVGTDVYDGELANVMLGFYGWRSGIDIAFERNGVAFGHAAGHLDDGLLDYVDGQVGVRKDGVGGWYDAGDYGKYLPTASESVNTMLAAWELFGDRLQHLSLPFIPEHGGELPDYLSEIKWELDWLLKMTYDDGSGRVHHKLNSPNFPGFVLPAADPTTRYFSDFSTAATAEFVATMAKAARAFAPYDDVTDGYSEKLLDAAWLSYEYLQQNLADDPYDNSVLEAGSYLKDDISDRFWAAVELWETTGDADVLADAEARIIASTKFFPNFDWDSTRNFGLFTYLLSEREGRDPAKVQQLRDSLTTVTEGLKATRGASGYGRDFASYYWGSNGVIARTCMILQTQYRLEPDEALLDVCADQIAYLYGRNQYNRSHVTGAGIDPVTSPHHRPSGADAVTDPYPGLLVGGGQSSTGWKDSENDYTSNEVAINWNSALVFALAGFIQGEGAAESLGRPPVPAADCGVRVNSVGYRPERAKVATVQSECELPSTFMCEMPESTLSGDVTGPAIPIDDLEDGDTQILAVDGRQGSWFVFDDASGGTRTEPTITPAAREGSTNAICISGSGFTEWGGGIGLSLNAPTATRALYDASAYTGIRFFAKGLPTQFRAMLVDEYSDPAGQHCGGCYDHFQAAFTPTADWTEYVFSWKQLTQQMFGDEQPNVCAAGLYAIQFQWTADTEFELCLDDVSFTSAAGTAPPGGTPPGGTPTGGTSSDDGCGCRVVGGRTSGAAWGVLGAALLLGWRRRRRA